MNKILIPVMLAIGFVGGYLLKDNISPEPSSCNVSDVCNLPATESLSAKFDQNTLKLQWQAVEGAEYYLVNIVDISAEAPSPTIFRKSAETSIEITDNALVANHNYRSSVSAVCSNCAYSSLSASVDACLIVVEDMVQFRGDDPCRKSACNCSSSLPIAAPSNNSFTVGPTKELYRVNIDCSGVTKWFLMQTENIGGELRVKIATGSDCEEAGYDGPVENKVICGQLTNDTPSYSINVSKTLSGGATFTLSSGCTWTVYKCNGCDSPSL